MTPVFLSPEAESDALEIWAYIAREIPDAADHVVAGFDDVFAQLAVTPNMGRSALALAPGLRVVSKGSHLIFYRVAHQRVEIARILHGARDIGADYFAV